METKRVLLIAVALLLPSFFKPRPLDFTPQAQTASALSGQVTSAEEGPMEGVVVSAKEDGSTISISVVTNPAGACFPGHETRTRTLRIESARGRL